VLQFIWRSEASTLQILGPYYDLSGAGASVNDLHTIVSDVVRHFPIFGLRTHVLVCDGSPVNRAWIQQVLDGGITVAKMISTDAEASPSLPVSTVDGHIESLTTARSELAASLKAANTSFATPPSREPLIPLLSSPDCANHIVATRHWFDHNSLLFVIVDPSHQMKSMRNQLLGNSKAFVFAMIEFQLSIVKLPMPLIPEERISSLGISGYRGIT
jgi:hypothetical protein